MWLGAKYAMTCYRVTSPHVPYVNLCSMPLTHKKLSSQCLNYVLLISIKCQSAWWLNGYRAHARNMQSGVPAGGLADAKHACA